MLAFKRPEASEIPLESSQEKSYEDVIHLFALTIAILYKDYLEISLLEKIWTMCGGFESDFESAIDSMEKSYTLSKRQMLGGITIFEMNFLAQTRIKQDQNNNLYIEPIVTILFNAFNINFRDAHENYNNIFHIEEVIKDKIFHHFSLDKKITFLLIVSYYYTKIYALKISCEYLASAENILLHLSKTEYADIYAQFHVVKMYMGLFDCNDTMMESSSNDLQSILSNGEIKHDSKLYHELMFCLLTESATINTTERIKFLINYIGNTTFNDKSLRDKNDEIIARRSLAQAYVSTDQFEHAMQQCLRGVEIAISTNADTAYAEIGALYNVLGDILYNKNNSNRDINRARLCYAQCLEFYDNFPNSIPPTKILLHAFFRLSNICSEMSLKVDLEVGKKYINSANFLKKNFSNIAHRLYAFIPNKYIVNLKETESRIAESEKNISKSITADFERAMQDSIDSCVDNIFLDINKKLLLTVRYSKENESLYFKIHGHFNAHFYHNLKESLEIKNLKYEDCFRSAPCDIIYFRQNCNAEKDSIQVSISTINFFTICLDRGIISVKVMFNLSVSQERQLYTKQIKQCSSWTNKKKQKFNTDLHAHFDAILSGEVLIKLPNASKYVTEDSNSSKYANDIDKFTYLLSLPHDRPVNFVDLEDSYILRDIITGKVELFAEILLKTAQFYQEQEIYYAELSMNHILLPSWLDIAFNVMPEIEKKTGVKLRFLAAIYNYSTEKEVDIARIKIAMQCPYIVGVDFAGYENTEIRPIDQYVDEILKWANDKQLDLILRIHAGETKLFQKNVESIINFAEIYKNIHIRIGHGVYDITDELLNRISLIKNRCIFEFQPDSNIALGVIDDFNEFPLVRLFEKGIPFVIGSDGYGFYRTNVENLCASVIDLIADSSDVDKIFNLIHQTEINYILQQDEIFKKKTPLTKFSEIIDSINNVPSESKLNCEPHDSAVIKSNATRHAYNHLTGKIPIAIISDGRASSNERMLAIIELIARYLSNHDDCINNVCILLLSPDKFIDNNLLIIDRKIVIQKISTEEMISKNKLLNDTSEYLALGKTIETFVREIVDYVNIRDGMFITLGDSEWIKSVKLRLQDSTGFYMPDKFEPSDLYCTLRKIISVLSDDASDTFWTAAIPDHLRRKFSIDHYYSTNRYSKLKAHNNDLINAHYINTLLLGAAANGQLELVKIFINQHANIESVDEDKNTWICKSFCVNCHSQAAYFISFTS